jgi:hypothetical protein
MAAVVTAFGGRGVAICSNGALVYDMHTDRVVAEHLIPPPDLAEAAGRLRAAIPGIGLAIESARGLTGDAFYEAGGWDGGGQIQRLGDAELFARPAAKLLGRHPRLSADEILALATPAVAGIVTASHSSGSRLIEISAAGVSKASALADLAASQGIEPAEVVAFGDMPNDLSMLAWAGTSYAVANAHPAVLAAAGQVIASNDEDGVAQVIDQLFPGPLPEPAGLPGPACGVGAGPPRMWVPAHGGRRRFGGGWQVEGGPILAIGTGPSPGHRRGVKVEQTADSNDFWANVITVAASPVAIAAGIAKGSYDAATGHGPFTEGFNRTAEPIIYGAKKFGTDHSSTITKGIIGGAATAIGGRIVGETLKKIF